ncbi:hypothetical protein E0Z10_g3563 [Xylaria hypoxylon]|uniref:Uncharacterized protein n=1 Tax=Xylaria hypoxylon TaxID=37992 RepID=A0A4Z0Z1H9_9PEZI|nr:hypothetical protein E0Z10_g3563 [Xylaria hypoxylon]
MALAVKHLNSDASFLLSFEPVIPESIADSIIPRPFTILLDPWITGPSTIFHPRISITSQKQPACISSLAELLRPPDLVIISQHKPDHCNEATLRQLPASGRTLILAEPASARLIRSWNYFDKTKVRTIKRWEDPRITGKQSVIRIPVPPLLPNGQEGEVTVAFIPQKRDLAGLHGAIGITYKSPPTHELVKRVPILKVITPPSTPEVPGQRFIDTETQPLVPTPTRDTFLLPPTPPISPISPISPTSLRSIRSASTLIASPTHSLYSPSFRPATSSQSEKGLPPSPYSHSRPISLIFSPHGIQYNCLAPYATSHLVAEAALPLTALLHCIDSITNPWWLGGNICAGAPYGAETASKLGARLWISAHDGEKDVRGLATGLLKTRRWKDEEIEGALENGLRGLRNGQGTDQDKGGRKVNTKILRLGCGEEILVSGTGLLWRTISSNDGIPSNVKIATETATPPPPTNQTSVTQIKHQRKHGRKILETLTLPLVQDAMSPKKPSIYKVLRTKDLIKPSPRLIIEREVTDEVDSAYPRLKSMPTQSAPEVKTEKAVRTSVVGGPVTKNDSNDGRSVRFALSTYF